MTATQSEDLAAVRRRFLRGLPLRVEAAVRPPPRTITRAELERERLIRTIADRCFPGNSGTAY